MISKVHKNTYEELTEKNPFCISYSAKSSVDNEVFLGFSSGIGDHTSTGVRLGYWHYYDLPNFEVLETNLGASPYFTVSPIFINSFSFKAFAEYKLSSELWVNGSAEFYSYSRSNKSNDLTYGTFPPNEPTTVVNAYVSYRPIPKLIITGALRYMAGIQSNTLFLNTLAPITDLGASAKYQTGQ